MGDPLHSFRGKSADFVVLEGGWGGGRSASPPKRPNVKT